MRQLQIAKDVHEYFYSDFSAPPRFNLPRAEEYPLRPVEYEISKFMELANGTNHSDYFFSDLLMGNIEQVKKHTFVCVDQVVMPAALDICLEKKWIALFRTFVKHYESPQKIDLFNALNQAKANGDLDYIEQLRALPIPFNETAKRLMDPDYWHLLDESREYDRPFDRDWLFARLCEEGDNDAIESLVDAWPDCGSYIYDRIDRTYYPALEEDPTARQYDGFHYALLTVARNRNAEGLDRILRIMKERGQRHSIDRRIIVHVERYLRELQYEEGLRVLHENFPVEEEVLPPPSRRARLL